MLEAILNGCESDSASHAAPAQKGCAKVLFELVCRIDPIAYIQIALAVNEFNAPRWLNLPVGNTNAGAVLLEARGVPQKSGSLARYLYLLCLHKGSPVMHEGHRQCHPLPFHEPCYFHASHWASVPTLVVSAFHCCIVKDGSLSCLTLRQPFLSV